MTPTRPDERYPGGDFPNQCPTVEGLPRWTAQDRSLIGEQLSVWHVFGVTHNPRPGHRDPHIPYLFEFIPSAVYV